jgi:hypothetical protein
MALDQTPGAMTLMLTTELVTAGRPPTRPGPLAHARQLSRRKQLELPHTTNCPATRPDITAPNGNRSCQKKAIADTPRMSMNTVRKSRKTAR